MDLFKYSDESGVFGKFHNEIFVYGGLIFIGKQQKDKYIRRYLTAEKTLRGEKYSNVLDRIFLSKKDKQRYLDNADKIGLKKIPQ